MRILFAPAKAAINNLLKPSNFVAGAALVTALSIVVALQIVSHFRDEMASVQQQSFIVSYIRSVRLAIEAVQQHRGLSAAYLNGRAAFKDKAREKQADVDAAMKNLAALDQRISNNAELRARHAALVAEWKTLKQEGFGLDATQNFEQHTLLVGDLLALIRLEANAGGMLLDPHANTYHLADMLVNKLPAVITRSGEVRGLGVSILARRSISESEKTELISLTAKIRDPLQGVRENLDRLYKEEPRFAGMFDAPMQALNEDSQRVYALIREDILSGTLDLAPGVFYDAVTTCMSKAFILFDAADETLKGLLAERQNSLVRHFYWNIALLAGIAMGMIYLIAGTYLVMRERDQARTALQRREHEVKTLVENAADVIIRIDPAGRIAYINAAVEAETGLSPAFCTGKTIEGLGIFPAETLDQWNRSVQEVFASGRVLRIEQTLPIAGETKYFEASIMPELGPDGGIESVVAIARNVTERKRAETALRRERDFISAVLDTVGTLVLVLDRDGLIIRFNKACEKLTGYRADEVLGRHVWDILLVPEQVEPVKEVFRSLQAGHFPNRHENHWVTRSGEPRLIAWSNTCITDGAGNVEYVIPTGIDVTERRQAERQIRLAVEVFENSGEGIMVTDQSNHIVMVNPAFSEITGYAPEEVLGKDSRMLSSGQHDQVFFGGMESAIAEDGHWRGEVWGRRKNGEIYPQWLIITIVRNDLGEITNHVALFADISERKAAEAAVRHRAEHDFLTGLPNRALLEDRLAQAIALAYRKHRQLAVLFLDLDHFKQINDTYGHLIGDQLLQDVAKRLTTCVRGSDTVCRLGGDEFVILLPEISGHKAAACVAEKILHASARPFPIADHELHVTPSIGIAIYPGGGAGSEELIMNADAAMYQAKQSGRNIYRLFSEQDAAPDSRKVPAQG